MKRPFRLQDESDFQRVWEGGRAWAHPWMVLRARSNERPYTRCGFVAGKKMGKAVFRNRAKRRMREAVDHHWPQIASGFDLVWIARPGLVEAPFAEVEQAVAQLLARAGVLRAGSGPSLETES